MERILAYLEHQGLQLPTTQEVKPSFFDPLQTIDGIRPHWSHVAVQTESFQSLEPSTEAMSLASMAAVHALQLEPFHKMLDMCAAPGMKSLYAYKTTQQIELYCNDAAKKERFERMRRLFEKHSVHATLTNKDGQHLGDEYGTNMFDRILLDAPCSAEGLALSGRANHLAAWSPAKVRNLQQKQYRLLKQAWTLLRENGRLVYATCTLNKNENERVIKKALGVTLQVKQAPLDLKDLPVLEHGNAWRIEPSNNSVGFFIAVLQKMPSSNHTQELDSYVAFNREHTKR